LAAGTIHSINISREKGVPKTPVESVELVAGEGIREDAHRGFGHRQVSLLMVESIEEQRALAGGEEKAKEAGVAIVPGVFAENLTTRGIDLGSLGIGDELLVGGGHVRLRVTQLGKECHTRCAIYRLAGDCIMPRLGVFCEVLEGGPIRTGDPIEKR
jgi:MOSC domain-containing protein YiiM